MSETAQLGLPLVQPAQAQKHVTVNEALAKLDGLSHLTLQSVSVSAPPAVAGDGIAYGVPVGATEAWVDQIAISPTWSTHASVAPTGMP